jgi:hypothetical protein
MTPSMKAKQRISEMPLEGEPAYAHLVPVVDALLTMGNRAPAGFVLEKDGWLCQFEQPLDLEALRQLFTFPATVVLSDQLDCVHCQNTWALIEGGFAANRERATRLYLPTRHPAEESR